VYGLPFMLKIAIDTGVGVEVPEVQEIGQESEIDEIDDI
jgi:hypothetical protein